MAAPNLAARIAAERDAASLDLERAAAYLGSLTDQLADATERADAACVELERVKAERGSLRPGAPEIAAADAAIIGASVAVDHAAGIVQPLQAQHKDATADTAKATAWARACEVAQERERRLSTMAPLATQARALVADLSRLCSERWPGISQAAADLAADPRAKGLRGNPYAHEAERKALARMAPTLAKVEQHLARGLAELVALFPDS